uniref:Uncharacterized protein n=1 Tax=Oncorhynchus tshawytscha TaxID=74940 RepID=A0AAZ3PW79_ONCTS
GYLESEEYIEHYGISPVWSNYRRNQKGGIPPQKTRNTCIVGVTVQWTIAFLQNVKLLQHFISPYTGVVYDPTRTVKMVSIYVPHVDFSGEDYSNSHDAVGSTERFTYTKLTVPLNNLENSNKLCHGL